MMNFNIYKKNNIFKRNVKTNIQTVEKIQIKDIVFVLILAISLSTLFLHFFRFATVDGKSMQNTLYNGEKLLLNVNAYNENNLPKYKDIIVIKRDDLSCNYLIKRVIGTEGDKIDIVDNNLYINNNLIKEDYIKENMNTDNMSVTIPKGFIFVMGDNRNNSLDSRSNIIGLINVDEEVFGKAIFNFSKMNTIN